MAAADCVVGPPSQCSLQVFSSRCNRCLRFALRLGVVATILAIVAGQLGVDRSRLDLLSQLALPMRLAIDHFLIDRAVSFEAFRTAGIPDSDHPGLII